MCHTDVGAVRRSLKSGGCLDISSKIVENIASRGRVQKLLILCANNNNNSYQQQQHKSPHAVIGLAVVNPSAGVEKIQVCE